MKKNAVVGIAWLLVVVAFGLILFSCKGKSSSVLFYRTGSLGLYAGGTGTDTDSSGTGTDVSSGGTGSDLNSNQTNSIMIGGSLEPLSGFSQVTVTIENIQLINTGSGAGCNLLTSGTTTVNFSDLEQTGQPVTVAECTAGPFNRLHLEFDRQIELVSQDTTTVCSFVSYYEDKHLKQPDVVICPDDSTVCYINLNGEVNVLPTGNNTAIFYIKQLYVSGLDTNQCTVTMKVSPLQIM